MHPPNVAILWRFVQVEQEKSDTSGKLQLGTKKFVQRGIKIPEQFVWVLIWPCIHKIILVEEIFGSGVFA